MNEHDRRRLEWCEREIKCIHEDVQRILRILLNETAKSGVITQLEGGNMGSFAGLTVGGQNKFQVTWNGAMQAGAVTTWTSSDPGVTITPDPSDPTGNTIDTTTANPDTNTSVTLTATGTNSAGQPVTATASVPVNQPAPTPATGGTITQLS